jgi:hypothetical protein
MVVKLFDSLVHGCYSGSYFVEIHFIIWPLRGGYRYPLRGGDSTILYLDSRLAHMLELSFSPLLCFAPIYLCSFTFKVSVPRVNIRVYDLLLVHGCYSGSYFVSAALFQCYIEEVVKFRYWSCSCFAYLAGALTLENIRFVSAWLL